MPMVATERIVLAHQCAGGLAAHLGLAGQDYLHPSHDTLPSRLSHIATNGQQ